MYHPDSGFRIPDFPYALKTRLKQTYKDFERIAELDPSTSSLKRILEKNYLFASEKQTNEVDNGTFSLSCEEL